MNRFLAATLLGTSALLPSQIPAGHLVGAVDPSVGGVTAPLVVVEPLRGAVTTIDDPLGLVAPGIDALLPSALGNAVVAIRTGPTSARLAAVDINGATIAAARPLTPDLGETVVALLDSPLGDLVGATPSRIFGLSALGALRTVFAVAPAASIVDLCPYGGSVVALVVGAPAGTALVVIDPGTGASSTRSIAIPSATCLGFDAGLGGFVVGDRQGDVFLVDTTRFIASRLAGYGAATSGIARNPDQGNVAIATARGIFQLGGLASTVTIPTPPLADLEYVPYRASFVAYGAGCAGAGTAPTIGATGSPHPGSSDFVVRLGAASPGTNTFLLVGLLPRALPLDAAGMPGCTLLVDPLDAWATRTTSLGTATMRIAIPPDPNLVNLSLFVQWLVVTPGANPLQMLASAGGRARP